MKKTLLHHLQQEHKRFNQQHKTWLDYMKKIDDKEFESLSKQLERRLGVLS